MEDLKERQKEGGLFLIGCRRRGPKSSFRVAQNKETAVDLAARPSSSGSGPKRRQRRVVGSPMLDYRVGLSYLLLSGCI